jgi:hypothetical protein
MGAAARRTVEEKFPIGRFVGQWNELLADAGRWSGRKFRSMLQSGPPEKRPTKSAMV